MPIQNVGVQADKPMQRHLQTSVKSSCQQTQENTTHIIFENQSAFLSRRLISDNVLVAFELMQYLDHKREGKDSFMAVKLDMSKVYDKVEWVFIEKIMERMGFHKKKKRG